MIICSKISSMIEGDEDQHQMVLDDDGQTLGQLGDPVVAKRAEHVLNDQIEARFAEKGGAYADSFRAVMEDLNNAALKQCYAGVTEDRHARHVEPEMSWFEASLEIDSKAKTCMAENKVDYHAAVHMVLADDPALRAAYGQA